MLQQASFVGGIGGICKKSFQVSSEPASICGPLTFLSALISFVELPFAWKCTVYESKENVKALHPFFYTKYLYNLPALM